MLGLEEQWEDSSRWDGSVIDDILEKDRTLDSYSNHGSITITDQQMGYWFV